MSTETKIESGVLSVRFDAGNWLVVDHGAKEIVAVVDESVSPRGCAITYRNTWGLTKTLRIALRSPGRLAIID